MTCKPSSEYCLGNSPSTIYKEYKSINWSPNCSDIEYIIVFIESMIYATKCSLRNDILTIYDRCKDDKTITKYQLEAINHSADIYFKLKGNSFVKDVVERVKKFELVD